MTGEKEHLSSLEEFVEKKIKAWAQHKQKKLEPKLTKNYQAVTNVDFRTETWKKGEGGTGTTASEGEDDKWRAKTWVGLIRVKVLTFLAIMEDTVLKGGKIPFELLPDPYDEINMSPEMIEERDQRLERMKKKLQSCLESRAADREYMKKWWSYGYYGMAFSKFNVKNIKTPYWKMVDMGMGNFTEYLSSEEAGGYLRYEYDERSEKVPGHDYVSVWNMVWDMEVENLDDGEGYAELIRSSSYDLKQLIGEYGYIENRIEKVIKKNQDKTGSSPAQTEVDDHPATAGLNERRKTIRRWEFYMRAPVEYVQEYEKSIKNNQDTEIPRFNLMRDIENIEDKGDDIEIIGEIADGCIIRFVRNESGERLHHKSVMETNLDESTGTGIADNTQDVAAALIGMVRAFEDNKKLSANVIAVVKKRFLEDPDAIKVITPGTLIDVNEQTDDVRKAILPIVFPDVGETLISGIGLMKQFMDDTSLIPTIMQGFVLPKQKADTAYEMSQLMENAGRYVGMVIRNNDEQFIEPELQDDYNYIMRFDKDESCKVNCKIKANGFTSFQNKQIRGERIKQVLGVLVTNELLSPYIKIQPHLDIIYESLDEDPERFIKTDEELQADAERQAEREQQLLAQQMEVRQLEEESKDRETDRKMKLANQKHVHDLELMRAKAKFENQPQV